MRKRFNRLARSLNDAELRKISGLLLMGLGYAENADDSARADYPDSETGRGVEFLQYLSAGALRAAKKKGIRPLLERLYSVLRKDFLKSEAPVHTSGDSEADTGDIIVDKEAFSFDREWEGAPGGSVLPGAIKTKDGGDGRRQEEIRRTPSADAKRLSEIFERDGRRYDTGFTRY